eukprot:6483488-Amphidinium_carterae.1
MVWHLTKQLDVAALVRQCKHLLVHIRQFAAEVAARSVKPLKARGLNHECGTHGLRPCPHTIPTQPVTSRSLTTSKSKLLPCLLSTVAVIVCRAFELDG